MPVALSGRVPVFVSNANGAIKVGDPIVASSVPGVGAKATGPGQIIGYALENYDNAEAGKMLVFIQVGRSDGQSQAAPAADNSASELPPSLLANLSTDLDLAGFSITNVLAVHGVNGNWSIDEKGLFTVTQKVNDAPRSLYAMTGANAEVVLSGSSQLSAGHVRISFTQEQKDVMAQGVPYRVSVTLTDSSNGVYVSAKDASGFDVAETMDGHSGATFDWMVMARRAGYENANDFGLTPDQPAPVVETPPVTTDDGGQTTDTTDTTVEPTPPPVVETPPIVDTAPDTTTSTIP
jgi:hypothetical protein